ncbi:MAG TPA: MBL fold metallo-hydrolase [Actinomycetota bacterium]
MRWQEGGERVYRCRYQSFDLNIGVVVGEGEVLVIDTRSWRAEGEQLREDLRRLTPLPCRQVVNTHMHFDHSFGNASFRGAAIWGHPRCAELLRTRGEEQRAQALAWADQDDAVAEIRATEIVPPDRLAAGETVLSVGGRAVELRHLGRGHTDNDLVVVVPDAGVLFAGDLVEEGAPPLFEDAFPLEWPGTVERLLAIAPPVIVPGHGDVVAPEFARRQRDELAEIASLCRQLLSGELSFDEALRRAPYPDAAARQALNRAAAP